MKHIMKRPLCTLLACCFILALAACDIENDSSNNDSSRTQDSTLQSNDTARIPDNSNTEIGDTDEPKGHPEDEISTSTDEMINQQNEEGTSVEDKLEIESFSVIYETDGFDFYTRLTSGQYEKMENLSADELPRDVVDLNSLQRDQIWNDLLVPLAADDYHDVTLYGVVNAGWLSEVTQQGSEIIDDISNMDEPVVVLRCGKELIVQEGLSWHGNAQWTDPPNLVLSDIDEDSKSEIAVCTCALFPGDSMGTHYHQLWIYDMEEKKGYIPDISNLDVTAEVDWQSGKITLTGGPYTVTAEVDDSIREDDEHNFLSYGNRVDFASDYSNGHYLQCYTTVVWGGSDGYCLADITVPVIYSDGKYKLGEITNVTLPYSIYYPNSRD